MKLARSTEYSKAFWYGLLSVLSLGFIPSYPQRSAERQPGAGADGLRISVTRSGAQTVCPLLADFRSAFGSMAVGIRKARENYNA